MRHLAAIAVLLASITAAAAPGYHNRFARYGTVINNLDLTTSRSFAIDLSIPERQGIYGLMVVWICTTDDDASVTDVSMACTASHDGGTSDYDIQDCSSVTDGVCASVDAGWSVNPADSSTDCWPWRADIEGFPEVECTLTPTGGGAGDSVHVYVTFAVKG